MIDFGMFGGPPGNNPPIIEPRKIFTTLSRNARFKRPSDEQAEVLDQWFLARDQRDVTVKMNTGAGKTLVGLLVLKSSLNEGKGPAVYVAPDNYLLNQVRREAADLGIATTDDKNDPLFTRGESILVCNVHTLFNGRSSFGVNDRRIPIGAVIVDDAHACLATIDDQFSITLGRADPAYQEIWKLFDEALSAYDRFQHFDVVSSAKSVQYEVPFWLWQERFAEVATILRSRGDSDALMFKLPLVLRSLPLCQCVFSYSGLEIAPRCTPISVIPSFDQARRRIYMTATLANDGILITHFGATSEAVSKPIRPSVGDMGSRMIIAPQELDRMFDEKRLRELAVRAARQRNVVVIVPSRHRAAFWETAGAKVLDKETLGGGVAALRAGHVGLVVLVNKYDGVDLPDTACELLILDGMPRPHSAIRQLRSNILEGSKVSVVEQVQRVEQGMGRGVRSSEDRCVIILFGTDLVRLVNFPDTLSVFTPATRAQMNVARTLSKQLKDASVDALLTTMDYSFNGHPEWIRVSKEALVNAEPGPEAFIDDYVVEERRSFDLAMMGKHQSAADTIQAAANRTEDDRLRGYLKQQVAEYTNFYDRLAAQRILSSAVLDNTAVMKPLAQMEYRRISAHASQGEACLSFVRSIGEPGRLAIWTEDLLAKLEWNPEATEEFEQAIAQLGKLLGFQSQRPERETRRGPDNLWALTAGSYAIIECKSGATSPGIDKHDSDQLSGSMNWFEERYSGHLGQPIMIHPYHSFMVEAAPLPNAKIIDADKLDRMKHEVRSFTTALISSWPSLSTEVVTAQLAHHYFTGTAFVGRHCRDFRHLTKH